jgi:hypothetical protein
MHMKKSETEAMLVFKFLKLCMVIKLNKICSCFYGYDFVERTITTWRLGEFIIKLSSCTTVTDKPLEISSKIY